MSNWTHVAGVIRADGINDEKIMQPDFDEIIGKKVHYHDSEEIKHDAYKNPEKYLPFGSEGSLYKTVWVNPDTSCADTYTITIFGDLRNHHSPDEIIDWFKKKCEELYVRNAVVVAENEWNGTKIWTWKNG